MGMFKGLILGLDLLMAGRTSAWAQFEPPLAPGSPNSYYYSDTCDNVINPGDAIACGTNIACGFQYGIQCDWYSTSGYSAN